MDPGVIAVFIPLVVVTFGGLAVLSKTDLGKAIAHRIANSGQAGSDVEGRLQAVEAELVGVRQELSETQERLDFAERLLAKGSPDSPHSP